MNRTRAFLLLILLTAFLLRIVGLGKIPAGFTPDEASQAYSAYSLLKTGRDEWGVPWPITSFKSFLDHKSPLQTYLMVPSIAIFGLNEFAARLPSAIFGTLAVLAVYLLAGRLFTKVEIGLLAASIMAISPWHLQFSRTALEVNLISFLFPIGLYFFLKGLDHPKSFFGTAFFWGLSLYSYHAAKIFIPLVALVLLYLYKNKINFKKNILPIIFFIIIIVPQLYGSVAGNASSRGSDLLVINLDQNQQDEIHRAIAYSSYRTPNFVVEKILHNKYIFSVDKFIENYLSYLSPTFWFSEGGRETTYSVIPSRGLLYLWQLPLIIMALYNLVKNKHQSLGLVLAWLFLAALPAAITKEGYRPNRAGSYAALFEILTAYGVWILFFQEKLYKKYLLPFLVLVLASLISYQEDYYSASATKYPTAMSYGWREAVDFIRPIENLYREVRIDSGSQSQSFISFYLPVDPVIFQGQTQKWAEEISRQKDVAYLDQLSRYSLGHFVFAKMNWPEDIKKTTLYVSPISATLPPDRHTLHIVKSADRATLEIFDFNK